MIDLEKLDTYLTSETAPENSMLLSDLDGFLTGVLCSPKLIMPSEWLPVVWGEQEPKLVDVDLHIEAVQAILERYNEVAACLNATPRYLEPIFWQAVEGHAIAMDWCEGFMQAVNLRPSDWEEFLMSDQGRELMLPLRAHLFDEDGNSLAGVTEEELDELLDASAEQLPHVIPKIFDFWQSKR